MKAQFEPQLSIIIMYYWIIIIIKIDVNSINITPILSCYVHALKIPKFSKFFHTGQILKGSFSHMPICAKGNNCMPVC